ncbi:MAG: NfeD family protein [Pseudomonadota bacterium]|nr:NfeD family protein [Pseudomonadota bacterium]
MDAVGAFVFTHPFWVWLAIGAVFLAVEVATGSGWMLWPAAAAALVGVVSLFAPRFGPGGDLALFAVLTIALTYVGRRTLKRTAPGGADINDAYGRLIGHHGSTSAAFEGGLGRVFVDGKEWSARLDGDGALAVGAPIEVTAVLSGARLKVRAL